MPTSWNLLRFVTVQKGAKTDANDGRDEAGFTLVEVLVALVILSISLSVLYDVILMGLRRASQAEKMAEATLAAQSLLAKAGTETPLQEGQLAGSLDNGFRWRLRIEPFGDASDRQVWPVAPYRVRAEVLWDDGIQERSASLTTLRLGPKVSAR